MAKNTLTIWVCVDCASNHHNGEPQVTEELLEPWRLIGEDEEVTAGMLYSEHADDCPNKLADEWVEECECDRDSFSKTPCDGCGNTLAGAREAFTLWY